MKAFFVPVLASALVASTPLSFGETAASADSTAPAAPAKKTPSADSLFNQVFSIAIDVQQTLAAVKDKESGDKAARKLQAIQKDLQRLSSVWEQLSDEEKEKMDTLSEEVLERMDNLVERCQKEGKRLLEARYYGSAALKDILENSDEFSSFVELESEECEERKEFYMPSPVGDVFSPDPEDLLPPN